MEEGDDGWFMEMKFLTNLIQFFETGVYEKSTGNYWRGKLIFQNKFQPWRDFIIYTPRNVYILIDGSERERERAKVIFSRNVIVYISRILRAILLTRWFSSFIFTPRNCVMNVNFSDSASTHTAAGRLDMSIISRWFCEWFHGREENNYEN